MCRARDLRDVAAMDDDTVGIVHSAFAEINLDMDGADAGMEIINLRYLARATLGETKAKPEELVGVPCRADGCGWRAVYRAELPSREDEPVWWTECARCGDRMERRPPTGNGWRCARPTSGTRPRCPPSWRTCPAWLDRGIP